MWGYCPTTASEALASYYTPPAHPRCKTCGREVEGVPPSASKDWVVYHPECIPARVPK